MKVLLLSIAAGGGHLRAAESLKNYILKTQEDSRVEIVDALKYINPLVDKLVVGSYIKTIKTLPKIYEKLYDFAEYEETLTDFSYMANRILSYKLLDLIEEFKPDIIGCTHPFPLEMVTILKTIKKINIPVVAILTDYSVHNFWLQNNTDAFIVANEDIKNEMIERGIPEKKVYPFGIPVDIRFTEVLDKEKIRKDLKLKNKTTFLIMGGSLGIGQIEKIFMTLMASSLDIQIIAVCGKNEKLKRSLERFVTRTHKPISIYGYTDLVPEFMTVSDFIITKPGGLTVAESLVKKLPIIIFSPIPGQEERNASYLLNMGLAVRLYPKELNESFFTNLINNPIRIEQMKRMAEVKAKPYAVRDITELMKSMIK